MKLNLSLDVSEALILASILDQVVQADFFEKTTDSFQNSVVRVYNRTISLISQENLDEKE